MEARYMIRIEFVVIRPNIDEGTFKSSHKV